MTGPTSDAFWGGALDGERHPISPAYDDRSTISHATSGDVYVRAPDLDDPESRAWMHHTHDAVGPGHEITAHPTRGQPFVTLRDLAGLVAQARLAGHPETAVVFARVTWTGKVQIIGVKPQK